jgi:hypothetical protein
MNRRKILLVLVTVVVLAGLGVWTYASGSSTPHRAGASSTRTTTPGTSATNRKTKSTGTTVPGPTTTVAHNPEAYATALFADWTRRDRASANQLAASAIVKKLFSQSWHSADGWVAHGCTDSAGTTSCTWVRPSGHRFRHLVMQVRDATDGQRILVVSMQITTQATGN